MSEGEGTQKSGREQEKDTERMREREREGGGRREGWSEWMVRIVLRGILTTVQYC